MKFIATLRNVGSSHIITIPSEIVDKFKLKTDSIYDFELFIDDKKIKNGLSSTK